MCTAKWPHPKAGCSDLHVALTAPSLGDPHLAALIALTSLLSYSPIDQNPRAAAQGSAYPMNQNQVGEACPFSLGDRERCSHLGTSAGHSVAPRPAGSSGAI